MASEARFYNDRIRALVRAALKTPTGNALQTVEFFVTELGKLTGDDFWAEEVS